MDPDYNFYRQTPSVRVLDNRGLSVRNIEYHRYPGKPTVTDERITRQQFDRRGFLMRSSDPRLYDIGQANFICQTDLAGNALRTQSTDAGITVALNDAAGRPLMTVTGISAGEEGKDDLSQAVTCTFQYEGDTLPGRVLSVTDQVTGAAARITERFVYASASQQEKELNLAGACVRHYDTAGLLHTESIALTGAPLSITRQLLPDEHPADWQGTTVADWDQPLASALFTTQSVYDATGTLLNQSDAMGHQQRQAWDIAGLLKGSWLTLNGKNEQVIVKSVSYSAAGQKLREEHGNGVVTTYTWEPETQRLIGIKTDRPAGRAAGAKVLQDLRYDYDPVGNVLSMRNDAEETRFWRNQKVVPENTYTYDSLYQLVSATGREMANAGQQGSSLPSATVLFPTDSSAYTNYTRTYTYDSAGNLTQIRHNAPATRNGYTTAITVSDRSNRGVLSTLTENPAEVDALFTAGGHQKELLPGQNLTWTPRGELLRVTPVVRDGQPSDHETYRYDAGSQRIIKRSVQQSAGSTQTRRALYLPGLELRTRLNGTRVTETLHTVAVGEAGRAQVRALHWEAGKPDDIADNPLRYSYDNLIGSSALEVDGNGRLISCEEYYPYGGTAVSMASSQTEADYKTVRYSGKERDATGLYYYGYRYYQPWLGRWLSADPAGAVDGLNLFRMVRNNPVTLLDRYGTLTARPSSEPTNWSNFLSRENTSWIAGLLDTHNRIIDLIKRKSAGELISSIKESIASVGKTMPFALGAAVTAITAIGTAMGFLIGKMIKNPDTASERLAATASGLVSGGPMEVQVPAAALVASTSAALHGATHQGIAIAGTAGAVFGHLGWSREDSSESTERGMAAATAAGAAVAKVNTLSQGEEGKLTQYAAAGLGGTAAWLVGKVEGSAAIGTAAGSDVYNVAAWINYHIESSPFVKTTVGYLTKNITANDIGNIVSSARDMRQTVSMSGLQRAFVNFFGGRFMSGAAA